MQKLSKLVEEKLKYFIAAVLLVVPLYPKFPFIRVPGTYVSIRFEDFLIVMLGVVLLPVMVSYNKLIIKNKLFRAVAVFLLVGLVSLVSGWLVTETVGIKLGFLHWARRIEYMLPILAGYFAVRYKRGNLEFFLKVIAVVVVLVFLYGFGQKFFNWPVIITQNEEYAKGIALYSIPVGHLTSTFAGHYDLSSFMVLVIPAFVVMFFTGIFTKKRIIEKIILAAVSLCGIWLVAVSGSRISSLTFLLAATVGLFMVKKFKGIVIVWVIGVIVFGMSTNLVARYERLFDIATMRLKWVQYIFVSDIGLIYLPVSEVSAQVTSPERRERAASTPTPVPVFEDRSTSIRLNIEWPRAVRALRKNPILGTGYSSITLATDNDYLRMLGEIGIFGFVSFMIVVGEIVISLIKKIPFRKRFTIIEYSYLAGYFGALIGVLLNAVFIDIFEASKFSIIFWMLTGIAMGLVDNDNNEQNN